jgi:hypothetical protein
MHLFIKAIAGPSFNNMTECRKDQINYLNKKINIYRFVRHGTQKALIKVLLSSSFFWLRSRIIFSLHAFEFSE